MIDPWVKRPVFETSSKVKPMADTALLQQPLTVDRPVHCISIGASTSLVVWRYQVTAWLDGKSQVFSVDVAVGCGAGSVMRQAIRDRMGGQPWSLGYIPVDYEEIDFSFPAEVSETLGV
jgi:hypothetical protein